ncbi:Beta-1,4-galactosyltransferase 2 [Cichlidogyrus casuarinus]|uniref:Beta-1,4-galactosyltransferase n=1 Tax=Cichlidogyrus casuarinus TaxID=1844966 RepID=A0ABD2Q227_9PLAT
MKCIPRFGSFTQCFPIISLWDAFKAVFTVLFAVMWMLALIDKTYRSQTQLPNIFEENTSIVSRYCTLNKATLNLKTVQIDNPPSYMDIWKQNQHLQLGGINSPNCTPFQSVALIVPYRNREEHLKLLLNRLHPMLKLQKLYYQIFVIEQVEPDNFNRGMLMNIGAVEALKISSDFDCFIFHDVDLLPEHDMNMYMCDEDLRGLAVAIDENRYYNTFENYAGGVAGISKKNFFAINGFPNLYWGWGNEDDDFSARTRMLGLKISRPPLSIGRYKMIRHVKSTRPLSNYNMFQGFRGRQMIDGLSSLQQDSYQVVSIAPKSRANTNSSNPIDYLFTQIKVNLNIKIAALEFTPIAFATKEELEQFHDSQSNNRPIEWPFSTFESIRWFLHFYGWL